MRFKVKDTNIYPIPGNLNFIHLGTISYGLREFIVFHCINGPAKGNTYIEEIVLTTVDWTQDVFANLKFINDDNLAYDLAKFAEENKITDIKERTLELEAMGKLLWLMGADALKK